MSHERLLISFNISDGSVGRLPHKVRQPQFVLKSRCYQCDTSALVLKVGIKLTSMPCTTVRLILKPHLEVKHKEDEFQVLDAHNDDHGMVPAMMVLIVILDPGSHGLGFPKFNGTSMSLPWRLVQEVYAWCAQTYGENRETKLCFVFGLPTFYFDGT